MILDYRVMDHPILNMIIYIFVQNKMFEKQTNKKQQQQYLQT